MREGYLRPLINEIIKLLPYYSNADLIKDFKNAKAHFEVNTIKRKLCLLVDHFNPLMKLDIIISHLEQFLWYLREEDSVNRANEEEDGYT